MQQLNETLFAVICNLFFPQLLHSKIHLVNTVSDFLQNP